MVASSTAHADELAKLIEGEDFFDGRYIGRVAIVHSNQSGELKDEMVDRLLRVEHADEPTEIVIHVNKLGEGWDVTNLYTIVPLRASTSEILTEQTIGRGLRLPYGKRTGVKVLDTVTIVAHDRFQEIIDRANDPNSIIKSGVVIGRDIPFERKETIVVQPSYEAPMVRSEDGQPVLAFPTPEDQKIAEVTYEVIKQLEFLPSSRNLRDPEVKANLVREVCALYMPDQAAIPGIAPESKVAEVVGKAVELFTDRIIDIPRVIVSAPERVPSGYYEFELDLSSLRLQPVPNELLIQHLRTGDQYRLFAVTGIRHEARLEDYVVRGLLTFEDVSYDLHRDLLYGLAGQVVNHLRGYLANEDEVRNVLIYYEGQITSLVHSQMVDHYWEDQAAFESTVSKGFTALRTPSYTKQEGLQPLDFRQNSPQGVSIRSVVFGGFSRCLYQVQKFDVMPELRFARVLEAESSGVKAWFRPPIRQIFIWLKSGELYVPDFIVETETEKLLVEVKNEDDLDDAVVQQKAEAAIRWCVAASAHEESNGGKPWRYLFIPHDQITASSSLEGLKQSFALC